MCSQLSRFRKTTGSRQQLVRTLARDNVDLVTEGIARITRQGIETIDGRLHELDVIVVATGFKSNLFLSPMEVVGPSGTNLEQVLMIRKE